VGSGEGEVKGVYILRGEGGKKGKMNGEGVLGVGPIGGSC